MNNISPKIAFLGGIFPEEKKDEIIRDTIGQPQHAANILQCNIIGGIEKNIHKPVTIFNALFIGSFPKRFKKLFIRHYTFNHYITALHTDYNIGFFNSPQIKQLSRIKEVYRFLEHRADIRQYNMIIGYSMTLTIVKGLIRAKKLNPNLITCLIVPDLPEYMNLERTPPLLINLAKQYSNYKLYRSIQEIDCFVVLTKYMAKALRVNHKPVSVIEGMTNPKTVNGVYDSTVKKFVYTGSLGEKYGIKDLVDAFHRLDENDIELVICGGGDTVGYIKKIAKIDQRIVYKGILTPEEVDNVQQDAYVFVNPRSSKEEYTKYSFPSKTLEYLASGHPILMYHLPGMPEEYDKYMIYFDDNDEDAMYKGLKRILSMNSDDIKKIGMEGKAFVEQFKTDTIQAKKIIDMYYRVKGYKENDYNG